MRMQFMLFKYDHLRVKKVLPTPREFAKKLVELLGWHGSVFNFMIHGPLTVEFFLVFRLNAEFQH